MEETVLVASSRHDATYRRRRPQLTHLVTLALTPEDFFTLSQYAAAREMKPHRVLRQWVQARLGEIRHDFPLVLGDKP